MKRIFIGILLISSLAFIGCNEGENIANKSNESTPVEQQASDENEKTLNLEEIKTPDDVNNAYKVNLDKKDFMLEDLVKEETCEGDSCEKNETTSAIDNIIYPLYVPSNTYLKSSEKIDLDNGNRVILTFSGEKDFVLVEESAKVSKEFEIIPIYGDPQVMSTSVAAVGANSIYFTSNNIDYYLASNDMSTEEMLNVASSLTNSISVVESK